MPKYDYIQPWMPQNPNSKPENFACRREALHRSRLLDVIREIEAPTPAVQTVERFIEQVPIRGTYKQFSDTNDVDEGIKAFDNLIYEIKNDTRFADVVVDKYDLQPDAFAGVR